MRAWVLALAFYGCDTAAEGPLFDDYTEGLTMCRDAQASLCRVYSDACGGPESSDNCPDLPFYANLTDCQGADAGIDWRPCIRALDRVPCPPTRAQQEAAFRACVDVAYPDGGGPNPPGVEADLPGNPAL